MSAADMSRARSALSYLSPDMPRDDWVKVGMALKAELGEEGFDMFDEWSRQSDRYVTRDTRDTWKSCSANGGIGGGTLFYMAQQSGWHDNGTCQKPSPEELAERRRIAAERTSKEDFERERRRAAARQKVAWILECARPASADHPYLLRKKVAPVPSLLELSASSTFEVIGYAPSSGDEHLVGRLLVVPVKVAGDLSTLELIDEAGRKSALFGGAKSGGYWAAQELPDGDGAGLTLLIGEGVATVLSAREATGHLVIAALSSGNLLAVAREMRERYPAAVLGILADLVKVTGDPDPHAIEAARAVDVGGLVVIPDFGEDRPSSMKDFNDLHQLQGLEAVAECIRRQVFPGGGEYGQDPGTAPGGVCGSEEWPEPQPLTGKVAPEPYPLDALPDIIRAAVVEVQGFTKAPVPLVASAALGAVSIATQAHVDVRRAERLSGPSSSSFLCIADSGERKTTCDGYFYSAIREYEQEQADAAKPELKRHAAESAAWTAERDGILLAIKEARRKGKDTKALRESLAELSHDKPEPPRVPKLLRVDDTPESLAWVLAKEWPSAGVASSDAGIVFGAHAMGKDSIMRNLSQLNILWDGGALSIGRRTKESFEVRGARLTMALQVQEATLRAFFAKSDGLPRGIGFLARFLVAWPESTQGFRPFTEPPANWPALSAFHRGIAAILNVPVSIGEDGGLRPVMLALAPASKAAWVEFHDAVEGELRNGGELYDVRDVASKTADNAVRLAALFQVFEHGMGGAVGLEAFGGASRIAAWHLNESRRFFGELALPAVLVDAARLDSWLIEHCRRERTHSVATMRVQQYGPGGLREKSAINSAVRELDELGRARLVKEGRHRRIEVNPALLVGG